MACTFCSIRKHRDPSLSEDDTLRIVREAKRLSGHGFNISLSGGEPTIYKALLPSLELAHKLEVNLGFTTNGVALTKPYVRRILEFDPFNINVSLESVDPRINERLRPLDEGTRRTLNGIDNVLAEKDRRGSRVSVTVKPTIMAQNFESLPDLVRHFGRQSQVQVSFQPFVGPKHDPHWVTDLPKLRRVIDELIELQQSGFPIITEPAAFEGFYDYFGHPPMNGQLRFLDLGGEKRNCDMGLRSMSVFPNGDVYFCDFLGKPVGDIHHQSLGEIFYGAPADEQRCQMIHCAIDCQQTCKRPVPLWSKVRCFLRMG